MRLEVGLNLKLSQQLRLAPQIIQSIEILQLPTMDLMELIENELQENEALEVIEPAADLLPEPRTEGVSDDGDRAVEDDAERTLERLDALADAERGDGQRSRAAGAEAADRKLEALQNTPDLGSGPPEHLMVQIEELKLPHDVRLAAEEIIYNLDEAGRLPCPLEDVVATMEQPVPLEVAQRALKVVQGLEPRGVGARDLVECLLLQISDDDPDAERKRTLIRDHLDDLKRSLSNLTIRPGAGWSAELPRYIRPDVVVEWQDGDYVVRLVNDAIPKVGISSHVKMLLREAKDDPKLREHLKRKVDLAKWLIEAIAQRQNTLDRVAKEIVARQRDYFELGVSHLRPLKMQEVADALGIHVSTVSRAISEKYVQEPRGITALKFFFTGGTENEDGGVESRLSVKERVREIIAREQKGEPLSDDQVAEQLSKEFGLEIARRTVTKYRKALNIPSSRQRRVWS